VLSVDEDALLDLEAFDAFGAFSLLVVAAEVFTGFPDLFAPPPELALEATEGAGLSLDATVFWGEMVWVVLGLTCTSQGGGALLYDGTILNVTDPRASRCNRSKTVTLEGLDGFS
jgi:hypothetical protein